MKVLQLTFATVLLLAGLASAADIPGTAPGNDQLLQRLQQLEAETQMLRAELGQLQTNPVPLPPTGPRVTTVSLTDQPDIGYVTLDEARAEMKKLAWTKGDFKIVPYGILWGTTTYETQRTYIGDYSLWAISPDVEGEDAFHVGAKNTRLGVDIAGPQIPFFCCAKSGGKVEIDFQGSFTVENKPGVLLRHAYWEIKDDDFRFLLGQTWDVISPLYPGTLMYSIYWGAGNIGYRHPQVRYERYFTMTDLWKLDVETSIGTDGGSDFTTGAISDGDHAGWPVVQVRVGSTLGQCRPIKFGVSGHIGEDVYDFAGADDTVRPSWSLNADLHMPITDRLGFQGELFTGTNLKPYLGGIIQGVDVAGTQDAIRSSGGWFNVWYNLTPRLHTAAGYTIDDPIDSDLGTATGRIYNQAYWGNISYDLTKKFMMGFEVSQWKTLYVGQAPAESTRFEWVAKYGF